MTTLRQMGAKIGFRVRFIEDPEGQWRTVKTDAELDYEHLLPWVVENRTMTDTTHDDLVQAAVERGFWLGRSCGGSKAEIDAALAAIRAGNNVLCVSCGAPTPNDFCGFCLEEE